MSTRRVWSVIARRILVVVRYVATGLFLLSLAALFLALFFTPRRVSHIDGRTDCLHQLGQVLELYEENTGGRLPPMESAGALRHAVEDYVKEPRGPDCIFRDPRTHRLFLNKPAPVAPEALRVRHRPYGRHLRAGSRRAGLHGDALPRWLCTLRQARGADPARCVAVEDGGRASR